LELGPGENLHSFWSSFENWIPTHLRRVDERVAEIEQRRA